MLSGLLVDLVPFTREWYQEKMHAYWNNESRLWATMGECMPISRASIARIIEERAQGRARGYSGVHFMIRTKDGVTIGNIGLNWVDYHSRCGYLGAWIGEEGYWGGGYGTDALLLVVEYAFDWLDLRRLALGTMALNVRAQRNVEKCGFRLEGRERQATLVNGEWLDALTYGMLRGEWPGRETLIERLGLREKAAQRYAIQEE